MRNVVVRSSQSGVWFGLLVRREGGDVTLRGARRAWLWKGALSCSELARTGPQGGSRICGAVSRAIVLGCTEILDATDAAAQAWARMPEA